MSAIGFAARRRIAPVSQPDQRTGPDPTFLEGMWNTTVAKDQGDMFAMDMQDRREKLLRPVIDELKRRGAARDYIAALTDSGGDWSTVTGMVLGDLAAARQRDPKLFASLPTDPDKFEQWLAPQSPYYKEYAQVSGIAGRATRGQSIAGTLAAGLGDPLNTVGLVLGGPATRADTFASAALREGINNAKFAAVTQPALAAERANETGQTTSGGEIVTNIGVAGALGGLFGAGGKGFDRALPPISEATLKAILPNLPARLREKYAGKTTIEDADLPDIAEAAIGKDRMTQDQRDAMVVLRRNGEIGRAVPYEPTGAGAAANRDGMAEAMRRILTDEPAPSRAALTSSTSLSSPRDTGFRPSPITGEAAIDSYIARNRVAESGGSDVARASTSSAYGRYQFTKRTWKRYYVQRYGRQGLTDQQIYARRADGATQDVLMRDLTQTNAAKLRAAGIEVTPGSLYVMHFAGEGDGLRVLRARGDTPIEAVMQPESIAANRSVFAKVRTAGELAAWADRRMGGEGRAPEGSGTGAADPLAGDYADLARLQAEGAALAGAAPDAPSGADIVGKAMDEVPTVEVPRETIDVPRASEGVTGPAMFDGPQPELKPEFEPRAPTEGEIGDAVRMYVEHTREGLRPELIADRLGIERSQAAAALSRLAAEPGSGLSLRGRRFEREQGGMPDDLLSFIAKNGGIDRDAAIKWTGNADMRVVAAKGGVVFRRKGIANNSERVGLKKGAPVGLSFDEMRAKAAEAGYLGSNVDLAGEGWTTEFQDLVGRAMNDPVFSEFDLRAVEDWQAWRDNSEAFADARSSLDQHLTDKAIELHPVERLRAADMIAREGLDAEAATARIVNEHLQDVLDAAAEHAEKAGYDIAADRFEQSLAGSAGRSGASVDGPGGAGGPASGSGAGGEEFRDRPQPDADVGNARDLDLDRQPADPSNYEAFSDPAGPATAAVADSLLHDMRPAADPAIAERQRQEAGLKADAPMRAATDQDSTIGSPLFDAADQHGFKLDDGDTQKLADVLKAIDDEEAAIKTVRDCL